MPTDNILFFLLVAVIAIVNILLFVVIANLLIEKREKHKTRKEKIAETEKEIPHECAHFFGYLSKQSGKQVIPDECFGCLFALDCLKAQPKPTINLSTRS